MEPTFIFAGIVPVMTAAFVTGLAGSLHCLGMCGGAISAMMLTAKPLTPKKSLAVFPLNALVATAHSPSRNILITQTAAIQQLPFALAFNVGRILSYSLAGAFVGAIGSAIGVWLMRDTMPLRITLFIFANVVMLLTGLYIAGWTRGLAPLERAGAKLWQKISPYTRKLLPVEHTSQAVLLGALWGWIPCGLVYAMLMVALASGSAIHGAATMFAFGIGTLPAMTVAGMLSAQMKSSLRNKRLRIAAGVVVMVMALMGLNRLPVLIGLANYATLTEYCHRAITAAANFNTLVDVDKSTQ